MPATPIWKIKKHAPGSIVAVALHDGHLMRSDLLSLAGIDEATRLREEDPYTGAWVDIADTGIVATRSRFEVDLNRPREKAVYLEPSDAWGLPVWKHALPQDDIDASLAEYDAFYSMLLERLKEIERKHGRFFIYDFHSYNHRRDRADAPPADPDKNPEINIGTGTMDRQFWAPVVDGLIGDLRSCEYLGRHLDVRENIKFQGGGFPAFIHRHFPQTGCAVAIEFKKFWMNEWTGVCDSTASSAIRAALASTVDGVKERLASL